MHPHISDIIPLMRKAGAAVMEIYAQNVSGKRKEDGSMVTEADKQANAILTEGLAVYGMPILSEETPDNQARTSAEHIWIIDPLDGTNDFLQKTNEFSLMVGLVQNGVPVLGAVYAPALDALYCAQKGHGAFIIEGGEKRNIHVSDVRRPEQARAVASRSHMHPRVEEMLTALGVKETIPTGSNGVKIGYIAEGKADIFINPTHKMGEWDGCAPQIILQEAGGIMTGVSGEHIVYNKEVPNLPHGILATNAALHESTLSTTKARPLHGA